MLHLYRKLLGLRRAHPALSVGTFMLTEAEDEVLSYVRQHGRERLLVVLNLGTQVRRFAVPQGYVVRDTIASTKAERAFDGTGWRPAQRLPIARQLGETSLMWLVHPTLKPEEIAKTCQVMAEVLAEASATPR